MLIQKDKYDFIVENTEAPGTNLAIIVFNRETKQVAEMAILSVKAIDNLGEKPNITTYLDCLITPEGVPPETNPIIKYDVVNEILRLTEQAIKKEGEK